MNAEEWRIRKIREPKELYENLSVVEGITEGRLIRTGQYWRKEGSLLREVLGNAPREITTEEDRRKPRITREGRAKEDAGKEGKLGKRRKPRRGLEESVVGKGKLEASMLDGIHGLYS